MVGWGGEIMEYFRPYVNVREQDVGGYTRWVVHINYTESCDNETWCMAGSYRCLDAALIMAEAYVKVYMKGSGLT